MRVGKRGGLARKGKRKKRPPQTLTTEQQLEILRLMPDGIGNRDQLPYTEQFDHLHRQFSKLTKVKFTKQEFWRAVSRVGKRSRKPKPIFDVAPTGELSADLVQFIELQNPWWSGKSAIQPAVFRRWAFAEATRALQSNLTPIVAIRGPRRVGKTTIQQQLIEELLRLHNVNPARILRVEFDDVPALGSYQNPVLSIVRWYEQSVLGRSINDAALRGEPAYLFFDEVQNLNKWAAQIKTLGDHVSAEILITGSSALRIAHGQDSLAGRISMIELSPLRLHEIAGIRKLGELPSFDDSVSHDGWTKREFWHELLSFGRKYGKTINRAFDAFSDVGGYPICHANPKTDRAKLAGQLAGEVVERTLLHDLRADGSMNDPETLKETYRTVCRRAGLAIATTQIKKEVANVLGGGISDRAVATAVRFLLDSMLVHEISPLEVLSKKSAHPGKLCLCDHFIREAWLRERVPLSPRELATAHETVCTLAGHIIESDIGFYLKGILGLGVSWFPPRADEPEIDFVLTIGERRVPIEVKYVRGKLKNGDLAGIRSFCEKKKYNADFGLVITQDRAEVLDDQIIAIPASLLLCVR